MSSVRKPVTFAQQQQLKCHLRSLAPHQLKCVLYKLRNIIGSQLEASSKMISYKCYEFSIGYKAHKTFGYGRNETEAHINCIQNFLELLIENESFFPLIKDMLTKSLANETYETPDKPSRDCEFGRFSHHIDETLALDACLMKQEDERERLNSTEFDIFGGNLGNISAIVQNTSMNTSKLDLGDFFGELNGHKAQQGRNMGVERKEGVIKTQTELIKGKKESVVMQGNRGSVMESQNSRRMSIGIQENMQPPLSHRSQITPNKVQIVQNDPRKENTFLRFDRDSEYGSHRGVFDPSHEESRKEIVTQKFRTGFHHRGQSSGGLSSYETGTEASMKREHTRGVDGTCGGCDCYKHLLEAMQKWETLEREISRLTQENQLLKHLLVEKQKVEQSAAKGHVRSGSTAEKTSTISPLLSEYSSINTQRRFTSHTLVPPLSINKENERNFNINLEQLAKNIPLESYKKSVKNVSQTKRSYKNPSMEENSLRKCVPNSYRNPIARDGSLTERSSGNSTLVTRDTNRDLSGQLSARTYSYKTKNW